MFQSVFNRRKVQRTINQITGVRRPQSPPSPASFVSQDVLDIQEKIPHGFLSHPPDGPPSMRGRPHEARDSTPQVHLELDAHRQSSYSDWFPRDLQVRTPPPRDASLSNNAAGSSATVNDTLPDHSWAHDRSFDASSASLGASVDDVIIIEPVRADGRDKALPPLAQRDSESDYQVLLEANNVNLPVIRKPTPTPIRIPDNPSSSKVTIQRSASAEPSAGGAHTHLPVPSAYSNGPSRPVEPGLRRDRRPLLVRLGHDARARARQLVHRHE
ncbi:hypothetical protein EVJ58_g4862 [Rhodofomes roseus]|uniref:Uncharacterized protein n=1 Tax=Rhodofomes roseus TaxID=34475 RepID=A0A4Y9YFV4_9APHY|nr:hypothetical protein EVJ58_g4862 [Rhodofomes roseus]